MANDNVLPADNLLALATLLKEALYIEQDLRGRIFQHPNQKSLLKQQEEYQQLVGRLNWELETALARYRARIKGAAGPGARTVLRPSGRASAVSRSKERRTTPKPRNP
jgi:hypothetical protein